MNRDRKTTVTISKMEHDQMRYALRLAHIFSRRFDENRTARGTKEAQDRFYEQYIKWTEMP